MNTTTYSKQSFKLTQLACAFITMGVGFNALAEETDSKASGIEIIEVTSTKRITNVMQTGQAVNAFNEGAMEDLAIDGAQDLVQYSPSLIIAGSRVSIRGVGRPNLALGSDPGVGLY
ncbi:MAG: iron complex outermembrane receptor protein, partial [Colwellia sp.]